jgi:hypothetical protein
MTESQFTKWLSDSVAIRCVLVEVVAKTGGVEVTRYLSSKGYVTGATDVPANTHYSPTVLGGIKFTESISLDGSATISFGDIEIDNTEGDKDSWLNDAWNNRPVKVFIGDVRWARADFYPIFDGMVVSIDSKNRGKLNLKLGDKLQRLNNPITEVKLNGLTANKDKLIPLCFGECHNISPLLIDPSANEFQVHNGPIERIIEVRDNGVPVAFTGDLLTGKFKLAAQPAGQVTCSVQGDKTLAYSNTIVGTIKRIVMDFGLAGKKFTAADLDTAALDAFDTANPQPVGVYVGDRANVLDVCNRLASSIGARVVMTRVNKLRLVKLDLSSLPVGTTVTASDMLNKTLVISNMPPVVAGVKLGYCKNFTVQSNLQTGIPAQHLALFAQDFLTITRTDSVAAADYSTFTEPAIQETLLLTDAEASAEATRRLGLFSVQRKVFRYTGLAHLMLENLGSSQTIRHKRFGLAAGVTGQIISLSTDWVNPYITVEVLI